MIKNKSTKILLIEDEESVHHAIKMIFYKDYEIDTVTTGKGAIEYLKNNTPDIILADIGLPDMNGVRLIEEITKNYKSIPIIVLSGIGDEAKINTVLKDKACLFLVKPFNVSAITSVC